MKKEPSWKNKITDYIVAGRRINETTSYKIRDVHPETLLVKDRIDLIPKLKYIENREQQKKVDFFDELYYRHIEAFSDGTFSELGDERKNNYAQYVKKFDEIIDMVRDHGLNKDVALVPVGANNAIIDGGHRVASSIYFYKKVPAVIFEDMDVEYDARFFEGRGLEEKYLDYMVLDYIKRKENTYIFCLWPIADRWKIKDAEDVLAKNTTVVYSKDIDLSYNGYRNLIIQVYQSFTNWLGTHKNRFRGALSQLGMCYRPGAPLKIFVVEADSLETVLSTKKAIRKIFDIGNGSIHSTDNHEETLLMGNIVLNQNSIHLLNYGEPDKYASLFEDMERLKESAARSKIPLDDLVACSSSTLGLYGIREPGDLDYISLNEKSDSLKKHGFDNHADHVGFYDCSVYDLLENPNYYLYFNGVKFITLDRLTIFKKNRGEKKDTDDIRAIKTFMRGRRSTLRTVFYKVKYSSRRLKNRGFSAMVNVLKRLKLYEVLRKIKHKVRG